MVKSPKKLGKVLGYEFQNIALFEQALTHRSVSKTNNERLEFLGDALLGIIIAEELYHRFPEIKEGELSRLRASLVKGETLSLIAREFKFGDYLRLGSGELKSGGANRDSILADSFEAVLGAMYLDSNFDCCKERVSAWYQSRLNDPKLFDGLKDAKTQLQEYLQAKHMALPEYKVVSIEGEAHSQIFTVECVIAGLPHSTKGSDTTRRRAEQEAAALFISWLEQDNG